MLKKDFKHAFYMLRTVLIAAAHAGVLILMMQLPGYLSYIITPEKFGPAKSVLLWQYWAGLCLAAWIILGPVLIIAYHALWNRKITRQIAMSAPDALPPLAVKRQRNIYAMSMVLSIFLTAVFTISLVMGVPVFSRIIAAKEDLEHLSRGEYESYTGSFHEIQIGHVSPVLDDNAPATVFHLYSQYNYRKGASSSYYFICPREIGRKFGFTVLRRENGPITTEIGPYDIKYLPNTHVITEIRYSQNVPNTSFEHETDAEHDTGDY